VSVAKHQRLVAGGGAGWVPVDGVPGVDAAGGCPSDRSPRRSSSSESVHAAAASANSTKIHNTGRKIFFILLVAPSCARDSFVFLLARGPDAP